MALDFAPAAIKYFLGDSEMAGQLMLYYHCEVHQNPKISSIVSYDEKH